MSKYRTTLKIVCAWCGKSMGEKEGNGVTGITGCICKKCARKEYDKMGLRFPKPWNLVGRIVEHFRRWRIRKLASKRPTEWQYYEPSDPDFLIISVMTGQPLVDYIDLKDISDLRDEVSGEFEMKIRWN